MKSKIKITILADVELSTREIFDAFRRQTPGCKGEWKSVIGTPAVEEADYYIVMDKLPARYSYLDPDRILLFQREPPYISTDFHEHRGGRKFGYDRLHHLSIWYIRKTYDELLAMEYAPKPKALSAIVSNKTWMEGHRLRLRFIKEFARKYPLLLDLYGIGLDVAESCYKGAIGDKFEGLRDYRYSLGFENGRVENYFTEKLTDCLLSWTVPIYWGCPNIFDYFPEGAIEPVDIEATDQIDTVPAIAERPIDGARIKALEEARIKILNEYNFWPSIHRIFEEGL